MREGDSLECYDAIDLHSEVKSDITIPERHHFHKKNSRSESYGRLEYVRRVVLMTVEYDVISLWALLAPDFSWKVTRMELFDAARFKV